MTNRRKNRASGAADRLELDHDWEDSGSLSVTIMEGLERVSGRSSDSFDPLYETIDVDALESLFALRAGEVPRGPGDVYFEIDDFTVTVTSEGTVLIGHL